MEIKKLDLIDCHNRIKPFIHNTPVLSSSYINEITGAEVYFKCENFQKMGAFKMRGAANAILRLSDEQKNNGVVTHSSGNHAQAISLAAKKIGIKAYQVMPSNSPEITTCPGQFKFAATTYLLNFSHSLIIVLSSKPKIAAIVP